MSGSELQPLALCGAFWVALARYRGERPLRLALGLGLGALLAHLGWALLHADAVFAEPWILLHPFAGFCVLFLPLGPTACSREAEAFRVLPLALAVARLGCVAAGCCRGTVTDLPWAHAGLHPMPLYETAGLLALHVATNRVCKRRAGEAWVLPLVLGGFGLLRLLLEPLRAPAPLGAPALGAAWLAAGWIVLAVLFGLRRGACKAALFALQRSARKAALAA